MHAQSYSSRTPGCDPPSHQLPWLAPLYTWGYGLQLNSLVIACLWVKLYSQEFYYWMDYPWHLYFRHVEKQEMEMKWKLETETGNWKRKWKRNLLAIVVIQMLLVFVPRHPSALPASSFCHRCPQLQCNVLTWVMFMFSAAFYLWCSILCKQLILYK